MARPGPQRRGCAPCAWRGSEAAAAAPRRRPHPPPSPAARTPRRPPAPARAPGAEGAGSASRAGGGPGAGAGGRRGVGARHLAPSPGRLGPPPAAVDLRLPARAARLAPWLRPYIRPRPPETPPPHVQAVGVRPGLCGHPAVLSELRGLGTSAAGRLDPEPQHRSSGERLSLRGFLRLRDPRGEELGGNGRAGTRALGDRGTSGGTGAGLPETETFLARGSRGRCRGIVKRNLPIMNSVSGNPHPPHQLHLLSLQPQQLTMAKLSKALNLLIRFYRMRNLAI